MVLYDQQGVLDGFVKTGEVCLKEAGVVGVSVVHLSIHAATTTTASAPTPTPTPTTPSTPLGKNRIYWLNQKQFKPSKQKV